MKLKRQNQCVLAQLEFSLIFSHVILGLKLELEKVIKVSSSFSTFHFRPNKCSFKKFLSPKNRKIFDLELWKRGEKILANLFSRTYREAVKWEIVLHRKIPWQFVLCLCFMYKIFANKLYGTHKKSEPSAKKIFAESKKGAEVCLSKLLYPKNSSM